MYKKNKPNIKMNCPFCGEETVSNAKFCHFCGSKLEDLEKAGKNTKICPNCGKEIQLDAKFCAKCGTKLI